MASNTSGSKKKEAESDLRERARHLFALCDKEEKGFVARRDMQVFSQRFTFFFKLQFLLLSLHVDTETHSAHCSGSDLVSNCVY